MEKKKKKKSNCSHLLRVTDFNKKKKKLTRTCFYCGAIRTKKL